MHLDRGRDEAAQDSIVTGRLHIDLLFSAIPALDPDSIDSMMMMIARGGGFLVVAVVKILQHAGVANAGGARRTGDRQAVPSIDSTAAQERQICFEVTFANDACW